MAKAKNFGAMTRALTGMSTEQYKAAYTKFAARVRNYNAVAGTNYSASREFYYSFKYADDPTPALRAIEATPATRARTVGTSALSGAGLRRTEQLAVTATLDKWGGFIQKSRQNAADGFGDGGAARIADQLRAGEITPKQANDALRQLARERDVRRDSDPSYRY